MGVQRQFSEKHEKKYVKFSEKRKFRTCAYQGGKKYSFFGKCGVHCFSWNTRFEIHPFALLPTIKREKKKIFQPSPICVIATVVGFYCNRCLR